MTKPKAPRAAPLALKLYLDKDELAAVAYMAGTMRMTTQAYLAHVMRIGHGKVVADIEAAMAAARADGAPKAEVPSDTI